jgi:hypothetical protein
VQQGRPLRVALDRRATISSVGQPITGTLAEPVYVYDRVIIPAGVTVHGHVDRLTPPSRGAHLRAILNGDFSPHRIITLRFDSILLQDGRELPIDTVVTQGVSHVTRQVAAPTRTGAVKAEARQRVNDTIAALKAPGKLQRLKQRLIDQLPYHAQHLEQGTVYVAELSKSFMLADTSDEAQSPSTGSVAPDTILTARLVTTLDSAKTPRGTPIEAVVAEPLFSSDHRLIVPEGTRLTGEVTFTKQARRFHRNGQLRFLFEHIDLPSAPPAPLLASLHSVDASADDHVAIDEEGGATIKNPKTRFIAPVLALLALRGAADNDRHFDHDGDANDVTGTVPARPGPRAVGGFLGLGLLGAALGQISRPVGIGFGVLGVVRTMYSNVLGKGREVTFAADTPIQVQLAPGLASQR